MILRVTAINVNLIELRGIGKSEVGMRKWEVGPVVVR